MPRKKQIPQITNSQPYYSDVLHRVAVLLTSDANLETIFTGLYALLEQVFSIKEFKLGLLNSDENQVDWFFVAEEKIHSFDVTQSQIRPDHGEAFLKGAPVVDSNKENDFVEVCTPIRLYSQNQGLMLLKTSERDVKPESLKFLSLISYFLSFIFADLDVENEKVERRSLLIEKHGEVQRLNKKLLSIIDVARSLAHELNQPLTGISGYCALILETLDESDNETIKGDLEKILEQAAKLEELIFKFQSIAHIEGRKNKIVV